MRTFETSDWIFLNSIIYKIYTTAGEAVMRTQFLEQIRMLVDYDSADFYLPDPTDPKKLSSPVLYNCDTDLSKEYEDLDYSRDLMCSGKSLIYRETDIISEEKRKDTDYYKKVYVPNRWHYSLQMVLSYKRHFVGVATFYRCIGKKDFEYDDIFLLDQLKDHMAYRLYHDEEQKGELSEKITVTEAVAKYGLTRREHKVLRLIMDGEDNEKISEELSISINTLKKHTLNIYHKLGINNRVQMFKMIRERE